VVGGILANDTYPADFLGDNLAIEQLVVRATHEIGVKRLLFLGSACIYPKHVPQPVPKGCLMTGPTRARRTRLGGRRILPEGEYREDYDWY